MEARGRPLGSRAGVIAIAIALSFAVVAPAQAKFEFVDEWGAPPVGELVAPLDVERDDAGNTYVLDSFAAAVHRYDSANNPVLSWGSVGSGPGEFGIPIAIGVNEVTGEVYVADLNESALQIRIQRFDSTGNFLGQFGSIGIAEGQFSQITRGIAVNSGTGDVYVTEEQRVQRFSATGQFELMWGRDVVPGGGTGFEICAAGCKEAESGDDAGELDGADGIATAGNLVFVAEADNNRISRFNATTGAFQRMAGRDVIPGGGAGAEICVAGCQAGITGAGAGELSRPRGLDYNDTTARLFIVDGQNDRVQRWSSLLVYQAQFGSTGTGDGQFDGPAGLTEDGGSVIVTDPGLARAQSFNAATGAFEAAFGAPGPATLVAPNGVGVGPGGVYVSDSRDRVARFDPGGGFLNSFGSTGSNPGEFDAPTGIAVSAGGNVYVADGFNDRVQRFDPTGVALGAWGSTGMADGQFNFPADVAIGQGGSVYVADQGNDRVQRFSAIGGFEGSWGADGGALGQFEGPEGIATDRKGNVYVADTGNDRIQKFGPDDTAITAWGASGTGDGQFDVPFDVAADRAGNVFVVEGQNNRVQRFTAGGAFRERWGANGGDGTFGDGPGEFFFPTSIAVDEDGYVYVADGSNNRVQKFAGEPKLKLAGKRRQDVDQMKLRVTCIQGPCKVKLTGAIEAEGGGSAAKPRAAAVKLKKRKLKLASGERKKVKLKLSKANARAAKELLEGGGGATAKVRGVARNEAGKDKAKRNVGLR